MSRAQRKLDAWEAKVVELERELSMAKVYVRYARAELALTGMADAFGISLEDLEAKEPVRVTITGPKAVSWRR